VFPRNAAGELVSEENNGGKFEYEYDALGNFSSTTFPDGRELATLRYGTGHLLEMQLRHGGTTHTLAAYGRDRLHREISRSQGVLSQETRYDAAGRVTQRTVLDARRELVFERRYRWDRTDQIVQQIHTDTAPATPGEKYSQYLWGYDAAGQVTKAVEPQKEERFFWDPAGNRTEEHRNPVWHNLLLRLDGLKLDYDGFGRLVQRRDKSGVIQHFAYDDEQRVKEITFTGHAEFKKVEYRYDPLGRRTHKVLWRYNDPQPETIRFDWQGLQLAGEQSDREPDHYVQYVYTEGSYEPLARIDSVFDDCEIYWYHTELNGLPERVTDTDGQTVWRGQFSTWGETERELSVPQWQVPQNLRFQGQYLDRESGLHYNLFRYYDPVAGRYTQMDPIGLAGGINTYSYVGDPLTWVDPLGLSACAYNGYFSRKQLRTDIYKAQRPGGRHANKHIKARTDEHAKELSLGKGTVDKKVEASYLPEYARRAVGFEKEAAYNAVKNGHVFEHGGTRFMFYKNPKGPVGYNEGKLTDWVRIEMTNAPVPVIHSFPASLEQVIKYIPGAS
ncbi:RHS repeat-associated core domain-containing protein, partial [Cronobacter malonaticus]|uniref:RHS repeat-associated core domain-containing protein n=1 Tax=Cronobacter malonaticus TaxID=413503 RepID=UPI0024AF3854